MANVLLLLLSLAALAHASNIEDCGSEAEVNLTEVFVSGCERNREIPNCEFIKTKLAVIELPFTPKFQSDQVKARVEGIVHGVPLPFNLPQPNACANSGIKCPLVAGEKYTYRASLPILRVYPNLTLKVKWELVDSNNRKLVCLLINVQIKEQS